MDLSWYVSNYVNIISESVKWCSPRTNSCTATLKHLVQLAITILWGIARVRKKWLKLYTWAANCACTIDNTAMYTRFASSHRGYPTMVFYCHGLLGNYTHAQTNFGYQTHFFIINVPGYKAKVSSSALCKCNNYWCIYTAHYSPALNRSSGMLSFRRHDAFEICNGIILVLYSELTTKFILRPICSCTQMQVGWFMS